ncbi:MAG: thioredoxin domain-containing protein [Microcoleaceae cyanobacterium]
MLFSISETKFTKEVLESKIPVLVHFWAPWCGLCRLIVPQLRQFQADWPDQIKVVGINADQSLKLASTYRLQTLPTMMVFEKGSVLYRLDHFQGREDLKRSLNEFMLSYQARPQETVPLPTQEYLTLEA